MAAVERQSLVEWQNLLNTYLINQMVALQIDQMRSLFVVGEMRAYPTPLRGCGHSCPTNSLVERVYSKRLVRTGYRGQRQGRVRKGGP
jgi:hypothetical protein